jgi:hypothetical protein
MPPQAAMAVQLADQFKAATVAIDLSGERLLTVTLDPVTADAASKMEQQFKQRLDEARKNKENTRKSVSGMLAMFGQPPELANLLADLADQAVEGTSVQKTGDQLVIAMKTPPGLADLPKALAPMIAAARSAAERMVRTNNLKQIGLAFQIHHEQYKSFPLQAVSKDGKPLLSWRVQILPYIEESALYQKFHLDEPWDSVYNMKLVEQMPKTFASSENGEPGKTRFLVFTGPGTAFEGEKKMSFAGLRDGTSNTLQVVEAGPDKAVIWTKPEDLPFDPENPKAALGEIPAEGFLAGFADGHVQLLPKNIDNATLKALITPAGGEPVNPQALSR